MSSTLTLSLSSPTTIRWKDVSVEIEGQIVDPRTLYTVSFQLLLAGDTTFGAWAPGNWDTYPVTPLGPFSATVVVGPGQPVPVNPGAAGTYSLYVHPQSAAEAPSFPIGVVKLVAP